jgi:hypothetical protein
MPCSFSWFRIFNVASPRKNIFLNIDLEQSFRVSGDILVISYHQKERKALRPVIAVEMTKLEK